MEWINVKERLPDENGRYLVYMDKSLYMKDREIFVGDPPFMESIDIFGYYTTKMYAGHNPPSWEKKGWLHDTSIYITHWMPLPGGPKKESRPIGKIDPNNPSLYLL